MYAVGGLDDSMCFNDVERYDPVSNSWSQAAPMNTPRGGVAVACLNDNIYAGKVKALYRYADIIPLKSI